MAASLVVIFVVGAGIRACLIFTRLALFLQECTEISTPLNSWKRVTEGAFLYRHGINPYQGNVFHETPIALVGYEFLIRKFNAYIPVIFVVCEVGTAWLLSASSYHYIKHQLARERLRSSKVAPDAVSLLLKPEILYRIPITVAAMYLFNPYSIMSCAAKSTTVVHNVVIAATLYCTLRGWREASCLFLSLAAYLSLYPIMLTVPVILHLLQLSSDQELNFRSAKVRAEVTKILATLTVCIGSLLYISSETVGGTHYLRSTYWFILTVPDLTPNIGLFWYFFTEMFDHFRLLFICTFQINAFIYTIPLALRLRTEPILIFFSLCCLTAIFKSYPSVGDVALYMAMLPMWTHLYQYIRQGFLVGAIILVCSVLSPILWRLWIFAGSANANFFFAVTLAFATAQIFLITDVLFAHIKREFHLQNGLKLEAEGQPAVLRLR